MAGRGSRADRRAADVRGHPGGRPLGDRRARAAATVSRGQARLPTGRSTRRLLRRAQGRLEVVEEDTETGKERVIRTLGRGESFGELGLVTGAPRSRDRSRAGGRPALRGGRGHLRPAARRQAAAPDFEPTLQQRSPSSAAPAARSPACPRADSRCSSIRGEWLNFAPGEKVIAGGRRRGCVLCDRSGQVEVVKDEKLVSTIGPRIAFRRGRPAAWTCPGRQRSGATHPCARLPARSGGVRPAWSRARSGGGR